MMLQEGNGLPLSGGLLIAGLLYFGASMFVTGPIVGKRTIEKSNWIPRCERAIVQSVTQDVPALKTPAATPDCKIIMGTFAGPDGRALCGAVGFLFDNPLARQIEVQNERVTRAHKNRIAQAASRAGSRCSCAVNVALENQIPWAIHAGSFRLVTPPSVANLDAGLLSVLSSNVCKGDFK